jgi:hypothetical protein
LAAPGAQSSVFDYRERNFMGRPVVLSLGAFILILLAVAFFF